MKVMQNLLKFAMKQVARLFQQCCSNSKPVYGRDDRQF